MRCSHFLLHVVPLVVLLLILRASMEAAVPAAAAVVCDQTDLTDECNTAYLSGYPLPECCAKLKEHQPCLSQYLKDPNMRAFVNSPNGQNLYGICRVPIPK